MNFFITLYTDASLKGDRATIAFRGKCSKGSISGSEEVDSHDIHHAEMLAIAYAIHESIEKWPELDGVFVNSDNLNCVRAFWTFANYPCPHQAVKVKEWIHVMLDDRWIRTKHVKAHTGRRDVRSYMNRQVDLMTKRAWYA